MKNEQFTNAVKDLEEYLGSEYQKEFCGAKKFVEEWTSKSPKTPDEMKKCYIDSSAYMYDLAQWHISPSRKAISTLFKRTILENNIKGVMDIGCGICSDAITYAKAGIDVSVTDLPTKYFEFGKWRINKYGLTDAITVVDYDNMLEHKVECVTLMDTLEHIPDVFDFINNLSGITDKIIEKNAFNCHNEIDWADDEFPCHTNIKRKDVHDHIRSLGYKQAFQISVYAPVLWVPQ